MKKPMTKKQLRVRVNVRAGFSVEECKGKCYSKHTSVHSPYDLHDCLEQCEWGLDPNK